MPGLKSTLVKLRRSGLRTGIITNGRDAVQNAKIDALGIRGLMDTVIVSQAVGVRKPDERIFRTALTGLGLTPQQAWFVGDNPSADILGAEAAGLKAVWMRGSHAWPANHAEPEMQIDCLVELLQLLELERWLPGGQA